MGFWRNHMGGWGYRKYIKFYLEEESQDITYYIAIGVGDQVNFIITQTKSPLLPASPRLYIMTSPMPRSDGNISLE